MDRGGPELAPLVLDASVALAWLIERPDAREAGLALALLRSLPSRTVLVPGLWHAEITNALCVAERRGRVAPGRASTFLAKLADLPIQTDAAHGFRWQSQVRALALEHGLSAYDAAYLELALREGARLATFDRDLARAAAAAGAGPADVRC